MGSRVALHVAALLHFVPEVIAVLVLGNVVETSFFIGDPAAVESEVELAVFAALFVAPCFLVAGDHTDAGGLVQLHSECPVRVLEVC